MNARFATAILLSPATPPPADRPGHLPEAVGCRSVVEDFIARRPEAGNVIIRRR